MTPMAVDSAVDSALAATATVGTCNGAMAPKRIQEDCTCVLRPPGPGEGVVIGCVPRECVWSGEVMRWTAISDRALPRRPAQRIAVEGAARPRKVKQEEGRKLAWCSKIGPE